VIVEISRDRFKNIVAREEFNYTGKIEGLMPYKLPGNGFISIRATLIPNAENTRDEVTVSINEKGNSIKKELISRRGETVSFP